MTRNPSTRESDRRPLRQELGHLRLEEGVLDLDRVARELAGLESPPGSRARRRCRLRRRLGSDRRRGSEVPGSAISATRAPRPGAVRERREGSAPAQDVRLRRHRVTRNATSPVPPGEMYCVEASSSIFGGVRSTVTGIAGDRAGLAPQGPPEIVARPYLECRAALAEPVRRALDHEGDLDAPGEGGLALGDGRRGAGLRDRTSTWATLPRRASSTTVNGVFWPRKRGGVVSDCTPGTVCRQTRYETEPTTARGEAGRGAPRLSRGTAGARGG